MREVRCILGCVSYDLDELNEKYSPLFSDRGVKGEVFGINKSGGTIKLCVDASHKVRAASYLFGNLAHNLSLYLNKTNGNAFIIIDPDKKDITEKLMEANYCLPALQDSIP